MNPLVTALLCLSQRDFFIEQWPYFLGLCLSNLKGNNKSLQQGAVDSLSRLTWVYMVRFNGEENIVTEQRIKQVFEGVFPTGSKFLVPRDAPLSLFVPMITFVAQVYAGTEAAYHICVLTMLTAPLPCCLLLTSLDPASRRP